MPINPGLYTERITIQEITETLNAHGGKSRDTGTPSTLNGLAEIPATVRELAGRELENAKQIKADISLEVRMRWTPGIKAQHQIIWHDDTDDTANDRTLAIAAPPTNPDGRREELVILCSEER